VMVFTNHQKRCTLEMYFRNGQKINGEYVYSFRDAFEDFYEEFPNVAVHYDMFSRALCHLKLGVWAAISKRPIIGPIFFESDNPK
ncbi:hypothetical protein BDFB_011022, partial [Asbolus verrucosus]